MGPNKKVKSWLSQTLTKDTRPLTRTRSADYKPCAELKSRWVGHKVKYCNQNIHIFMEFHKHTTSLPETPTKQDSSILG